MNKRFRLTVTQKRDMAGYVFALPFILGFTLFFLYPFIQSLVFSFNELEVTEQGYNLNFVGWLNYNKALLVHPTFSRTAVNTILNMLLDVPLILMFSYFAACLLNQQFKGRLVARLIFFLPVILASGVIASMEQQDYMMQALQPGQLDGSGFLSGAAVRMFVSQLRLPDQMLTYITSAVDRIPIIIRASGIQILVFLAGLQSIPSSLYEASAIEGATAWEDFWKITFPLMTPHMLTNIVYSVIDSFTSPHNQLITLIRQTAFGGLGFGVSSAMSWIYFAAIAVILTIGVGIISRWVFYQE
ncbi:MAG: sugar ABC transporter permease [Bacillota bacterium]|jgi:ABC-type sugar transport system permease subunit|nr:sugar ABC transporter permease [Bacillota bacterium]HPZ55074.1 sugar ABC transporter permease [Bacillota bacterium]HQD18434.1 sugar ABC transporter permease [Bacillota bacterium]